MMDIEILRVPYLGQITTSYTFCTPHYRIFIDSALKRNEERVAPLLRDGRQSVVLLTHGHWDHIGCSSFIQKNGGQLYISADDLPWLTDFSAHWHNTFGQFAGDVPVPQERYDTFWADIGQETQPDGFVRDGQELHFDELTIRVVALPGHTKGSVGYYLPAQDLLFTGDALMHPGFFGCLAQYYDAAVYRESMERLARLTPASVYTAHTEPYLGGAASQAARDAIAVSHRIEAAVGEYVQAAPGALSVGDAARYVCDKLSRKVGCGACITVLNHMAHMPEAAGRLDLSGYRCGV